MEYEKVNEVPKIEYVWKAGKETEKYTAALATLKPGEVMAFRINRNQTKKEMYKEAAAKEVLLRTAMKRAPGTYVKNRRDFDLYVKCLENTGAQP